jgi:hypothetical protein
MPKSDRWKREGKTGLPVLSYTSIPLCRIGQPLLGDPSASQAPILSQLRWLISCTHLGPKIYIQPQSERPLKLAPASVIWTPTQIEPAHMSTVQTLNTSACQYNTHTLYTPKHHKSHNIYKHHQSHNMYKPAKSIHINITGTFPLFKHNSKMLHNSPNPVDI